LSSGIFLHLACFGRADEPAASHPITATFTRRNPYFAMLNLCAMARMARTSTSQKQPFSRRTARSNLITPMPKPARSGSTPIASPRNSFAIISSTRCASAVAGVHAPLGGSTIPRLRPRTHCRMNCGRSSGSMALRHYCVNTTTRRAPTSTSLLTRGASYSLAADKTTHMLVAVVICGLWLRGRAALRCHLLHAPVPLRTFRPSSSPISCAVWTSSAACQASRQRSPLQ